MNLKYPSIVGKVGEELTAEPPTLESGENVRYTTSSTLPIGVELDAMTGQFKGIPKQAFSKSVKVTCSNPSASIDVDVMITITACDGGKKYVSFSYEIGNKEVSISLKDSTQVDLVNIASGSLVDFATGEAAQCISAGSATLTIQSNAKSGGSYSLYVEGELLKMGEWKDTSDVVSFQFNVQDSAVPTISSYSQPTQVYIGVSYSFYPTLLTGASKFDVSGSLPDTMKFDSTTGVLTGSMKGTTLSLTITPSNSAGKKGTAYTLTITAISCPQTLIGLKVIGGTDAADKKVTFQPISGNVLVDLAGFKSNTEKTYTFCQATGQYMISVGSTINKRWSDGSSVAVLLENDKLLGMSLESDIPSTVKILQMNTFVNSNSQWQLTTTEPLGGWNNEFSTTAGWQTVTASNFPSRLDISTYYRTKFDFTDSIADVAELQLSLTFDAGVICYLNGNEFYRRNLPMTGVTHYFRAQAVFAPARVMSITVGKHLLQTGTNILAIEVHKHGLSLETDPLKVILTPLLSSNADGECSIRTLSSTSSPTMDSSTTFGYASSSNALKFSYDYSDDTFYQSDIINEVPGEMIFKWPVGVAEFINTLSITPVKAPTANDLTFKNIVFYGAFNRDSPEWLKVREFTGMSIYGTAPVVFEMENNVRSFEAYRIQVREFSGALTSTSYTSVAEMVTKNCKPAICAQLTDTDGSIWKETVAGNRAFLSCPTGQYGYRERYCFKINSIQAQFLNVESQCSVTPATEIKYGLSNNELTFLVGQYGNFTPTINGGIDSYAIDCILPTGIIFNPRYGRILGEPSAAQDEATECKVTGKIGTSSITSTVKINVKELKCASDGTFAETSAGKYATQPCGSGYDGLQKKYCDGSSGVAVWDPLVDRTGCTLKSPFIDYGAASYTFNLEETVSLVPTLDAAQHVVTCGTLPTGLMCNSTSGEIYGTTLAPTVAQGINVKVTVVNAAGLFDAYVILIVTSTKAAIKYNPSTYTFYVGFQDTTTAPEGTGVTFLQVVPTLPTGLVLNTANGVISGTIVAGVPASSLVYSVQGYKDGQLVQSNPLTITVIQPQCPYLSEDFPATNAGETVEVACPAGQAGTRKRSCSKEKNPSWTAEESTCQTDIPICQAADGFPDTPANSIAMAPCDSGSIGNKTRSCGWDSKGNPAWQNINTAGCVLIAPSISYYNRDIQQLTGIAIPPNKPSLYQIEGTLTISPTLQSNFMFDQITGEITGSGAREQAKTTYTISGKGIDGKTYKTTITITITDQYATKIEYKDTTQTFYVEIKEESYDGAIADGVVKKYRISPTLPSGLTISSDSGKIYGTVAANTTDSSKEYVITAELYQTNTIQTTIKIVVIQPKCKSVSSGNLIWPDTNAGVTVTLECPTGYDGNKQRACGEGKTPVWGQETGTCTAKLPSFNYPQSSYSFSVNDDIGTIAPQNIQNGPVSSWESSCSVTLVGIAFNTATGEFSGIPTSAFTSVCRVKASNSFGKSNEVSITFSVTLPKCTASGKWTATDMGKYVQTTCDEGYGIMFRKCESDSTGTKASWGTIDTSQCRAEAIYTPDPNKSHVKVTLVITKVSSALSSAMKFAIQVAMAESLNVDYNKVRVEQHENRLRALQTRTVTVDVYIETDNVSGISSEISSTSTQQLITSKIKNSSYSGAFSSASVTYESPVTIGKEKSSSSVGAIVGGIVGGLAAILIIAVIVVLYSKNRTVVVRKPTAKSTKTTAPKAKKSAGVRIGQTGDNYANLGEEDDDDEESGKKVEDKKDEKAVSKKTDDKKNEKGLANKEESDEDDDDEDDSDEEETAL